MTTVSHCSLPYKKQTDSVAGSRQQGSSSASSQTGLTPEKPRDSAVTHSTLHINHLFICFLHLPQAANCLSVSFFGRTETYAYRQASAKVPCVMLLLLWTSSIANTVKYRRLKRLKELSNCLLKLIWLVWNSNRFDFQRKVDLWFHISHSWSGGSTRMWKYQVVFNQVGHEHTFTTRHLDDQLDSQTTFPPPHRYAPVSSEITLSQQIDLLLSYTLNLVTSPKLVPFVGSLSPFSPWNRIRETHAAVWVLCSHIVDF